MSDYTLCPIPDCLHYTVHNICNNSLPSPVCSMHTRCTYGHYHYIVEGIDFVGIRNLNWTLNLNISIQCMTVNIINDQKFEDNETFGIMASYLNVNTTSARITIEDDEGKVITDYSFVVVNSCKRQLRFDSVAIVSLIAPESVLELDAGNTSVCARLNGPSGGLERNVNVSIQFDLSDVVIENMTLSFTSNSLQNSIPCVEIPVEDNQIFEDNRTLIVTLYGTPDRVTVLDSPAEIIIIDDDGKEQPPQLLTLIQSIMIPCNRGCT